MLGTRAISTTSRRELSSSFFFPARQGAEGNSRSSDRNNGLFPSWSGQGLISTPVHCNNCVDEGFCVIICPSCITTGTQPLPQRFPHSTIWCFLFQFPVSCRFLEVIQHFFTPSSSSSRYLYVFFFVFPSLLRLLLLRLPVTSTSSSSSSSSRHLYVFFFFFFFVFPSPLHLLLLRLPVTSTSSSSSSRHLDVFLSPLRLLLRLPFTSTSSSYSPSRHLYVFFFIFPSPRRLPLTSTSSSSSSYMQVFDLLRCYASSIGSYRSIWTAYRSHFQGSRKPRIWNSLTVPFSWVQQSKNLEQPNSPIFKGPTVQEFGTALRSHFQGSNSPRIWKSLTVSFSRV